MRAWISTYADASTWFQGGGIKYQNVAGTNIQICLIKAHLTPLRAKLPDQARLQFLTPERGDHKMIALIRIGAEAYGTVFGGHYRPVEKIYRHGCIERDLLSLTGPDQLPQIGDNGLCVAG